MNVLVFSPGSRPFLTRGRGHSPGVLLVNPGWKGCRVQLEEADLQDHCPIRRAHSGVFQDSRFPQAIGMKRQAPSKNRNHARHIAKN